MISSRILTSRITTCTVTMGLIFAATCQLSIAVNLAPKHDIYPAHPESSVVHTAGQFNATFNVQDFGAVGDGVTDDTDAIQLAIDTAANATVSFLWEGGPSDHAEAVTSRSVVVFPRGHYVISRTLVLGYANTRIPGYLMPPDFNGQGGRPILRQTDNASDIIFGSQVVRWRVTGLTLIGGLNQLHVGNNNTDKGQILVDDCTFMHSHGAAIRLLEPSAGMWPSNVGQKVEEGRRPHHDLPKFCGSFSTHVHITRSVFDSCDQALVNWADWTTVDNCWVTTSVDMTNNSAVFENHDRLFLSNILGVPRDLAGAPAQQRWVDNYAYRYDGGRVSMTQFRFGGEGKGMSGVYNFAPFACQEVISQYSHMALCGRIPHTATAVPPNTSIVPGSALTITNSQIDTHQAIVLAIEVPAHVTVSENELRPGSSSQPTIFVINIAADLSQPLFATLFHIVSDMDSLVTLSYDISASNWNGPTMHEAALPQQLWPYALSTTFRSKQAPVTGAWRAGAIVIADPPSTTRYGFFCEVGGSPGTWKEYGLVPSM
eukprot:m.32587 g.32587  ORF g.32587 m.32587 type:complete len:543 (+) comp16666_c1_seq2:178-1806(+)